MLHGVIALKDGRVVDISIGRNKNDPQFIIPILLPHLAADQMKKPMSEAFTGEGLNILIGSVRRPETARQGEAYRFAPAQ